MHETQKEYGRFRTYIMNVSGIRVIRFKNENVIEKLSELTYQIREKF